MDNLSDIPVRPNTELSDEESDIIREYFGDTNINANDYSGECRPSWTNSVKVAGYGVILFSVLGNPWIDSLFSKIPYVPNNSLIILCIKLFIFMIILVLTTKFSS